VGLTFNYCFALGYAAKAFWISRRNWRLWAVIAALFALFTAHTADALKTADLAYAEAKQPNVSPTFVSGVCRDRPLDCASNWR
jgi:hypothetical protein